MSKEKQLEDLIYEVICDIESDIDNELTISDIYKKLIKVEDILKDKYKEFECILGDNNE